MGGERGRDRERESKESLCSQQVDDYNGFYEKDGFGIK